MTEQEEFEFRHRLEQEQAASSVQPQVQQAPQEDSWYKPFLDPIPKDITPMQRVERLGQAGLLGMGAGGLLGTYAMPGLGTAAGAGTGFVGGLMGEGTKQLSAAFGATPEKQEVSGLVGGLVSPNPMPILKGSADLIGKFGTNYFMRNLGRTAAEAMAPGTENTAAAEAVRAAQAAMLEGRAAKEGAESLGSAITQHDIGAKTALENLFKQNTGKAMQTVGMNEVEMLDKVRLAQQNAVREKLAKERTARFYDTARQATEQELTTAKNAGIGAGKDDYRVGLGIRDFTASKYSKIHSDALSEYSAVNKQVMADAEKTQAAGEYWPGTPEGLAVEAKYRDLLAKGRESSVKKDLENILNQIWGSKEVTTSAAPDLGYGGLTGTTQSVTEKVPEYASAQKLDDIVRKLGQVYEKDGPEGFAAIGGSLAKQLRRDLTKGVDGNSGFYDWAGLGPNKSMYADAMEKLSVTEAGLGKHVLKKAMANDDYINQAESIVPKAMGSIEGIQDLQRLVQDPAKAKEFVEDYVAGKVKGKSAPEIADWFSKHQHIAEMYPDVAAKVQAHAEKVGALEAKVAELGGLTKTTTQAAQRPMSLLEKFIPEQKQAVETTKKQILTELEQTNAQLADAVKTTGLLGEGGKFVNPGVVIDKLLKSNPTVEQLQAVSSALTNVPGASNKLLDATAAHLSRIPAKNAMQEFERILPVLQGATKLDEAGVNALRDQVQQIVLASQKSGIDLKGTLLKAFKTGARNVAVRETGAATAMAVPRLSIFGKKEEQK